MLTVVDALKWIVDSLLNRRKENLQIKKEKWNQVAAYLNEVSETIQGCVNDLKKGTIPHGHYSLLSGLATNFEKVLRQVYDYKSENLILKKYKDEFSKAVHLVEGGDSLVYAGMSTKSESGKQLIADLEACQAQFRALSITLKAMA